MVIAQSPVSVLQLMSQDVSLPTFFLSSAAVDAYDDL